jgi:hypothetical protein
MNKITFHKLNFLVTFSVIFLSLILVYLFNDKSFDSIQNPVERLVELISMLSKFSVLTSDEWRDFHDMERETLEYNYHHYVSRDYLKCLERNS